MRTFALLQARAFTALQGHRQTWFGARPKRHARKSTLAHMHGRRNSQPLFLRPGSCRRLCVPKQVHPPGSELISPKQNTCLYLKSCVCVRVKVVCVCARALAGSCVRACARAQARVCVSELNICIFARACVSELNICIFACARIYKRTQGQRAGHTNTHPRMCTYEPSRVAASHPNRGRNKAPYVCWRQFILLFYVCISC